MYDYGELSDMEDVMESNSVMEMSNADKIELKKAQDNVIINEAVDEFIQDKRMWFRDLKKKHGDDLKTTAEEKGNEFLKGTAKYIGRDLIPIQGEIGEEDEKKILK